MTPTRARVARSETVEGWAPARARDAARALGELAAVRDDHDRWMSHVAGAAGCSHPIRLVGSVTHVEAATGRITRDVHTTEMPDGVLYTPCGNRRATVCPSCAETYRADTYQLVPAGLVGGKGVPAIGRRAPVRVPHRHRPLASARSTPHRTDRAGRTLARAAPAATSSTARTASRWPASTRHADDAPELGRPLCLDCYDHPAQAVWNLHAGELWRRTMIAARRGITALEKRHRIKLRLCYTKVAEFQARGAVHFHALVRLDGLDPIDPDAVLVPDAGSAPTTSPPSCDAPWKTPGSPPPPHPARELGWPIAWGEQVDPRPVRLSAWTSTTPGRSPPAPSPATSPSTPPRPPNSPATPPTRLAPTPSATTPAWTPTPAARSTPAGTSAPAPRPPTSSEWAAGWGRLRRWAHMLGFGGHFSTRSRRYSTTLGALRQARRDWRREHAPRPDEDDDLADEDTTEVIVDSLAFAGIGWHTSADALLANTSAANARARARAAKEETTPQPDQEKQPRCIRESELWSVQDLADVPRRSR